MKLNEIVKLVATAQPNEKKYILLCGAGVSIDAGVPTGWQIMMNTVEHLRKSDGIESTENIESWFENSEYADCTYSEILEKVFPYPNNQQEYFEGHLENKEIGESHTLIAQLAQKGIIRAIVTTNFDRYIEKSLDEKNIKYQVLQKI